MKFLPDTNIVPELMKAAPDQGVIAWMHEHDAETNETDFPLMEVVNPFNP